MKSYWKLFVAALCAATSAGAAQSTQVPLPGSSIPQFVQPLPTLSVTGGKFTTIFGNRSVDLRMCEFKANILPPGTPITGKGQTTVWGYINDAAQCPTAKLADETYLGPVFVNTRGSPTTVNYINDLGDTTTSNLTFWKFAIDQTLHWADPLNGEANQCNMAPGFPAFGSPCAQNYTGPIPAVPHLHGGEVPPELDGGPDAWFTSDGLFRGHGYYSKGAPGNGAIYAYPNTQENSPIWFHDHLLGGTRLNVYAGLAGAYYIEDPAIYPAGTTTANGTPGTCTTGCLPANLTPVAQIVPLVIQDRMFDTTGELFFPSDSAGGVLWTTNPEHPYWVPEFVGDAIVVNGKAWPYLDVQPKRYRFLFLNGSNARTYELFLVNPVTKAMGPPVYVIGTDGGYLDTPVKLDPNAGQRLVIMPGERYEAIIDFAGIPAGTNLILKNVAKTPYPAGAAPNGNTVGRIMQFRVKGTVASDASYNPASGAPLRGDGLKIQRLANPAAGTVAPGIAVANTRRLTLNEVLLPAKTVVDPVTNVLTAYPGGPVEILVNNTKWSGESPRTYGDFTPITVNGITTAYSELPREGDTEVWEIVNTTADAHPMHLHLVQFQLINRQSYNAANYAKAYAVAFPAVPGDPTCIGGVYCPGFGPPLNYNVPIAGAIGGNPDVTPFLQGKVMLPLPQEQGWKDTIMVPPGQVTRLAVRWAPTSIATTAMPKDVFFPFDPNSGNQHGYVWHCHIVDHEDNEMMRPDVVQLNLAAPAPASRPLVKGSAY